MKRFLPLAALALFGCEERRDWQGWVYPNRHDLTDDVPIGAFSTLGQCSATAKALIVRLEERRDEEDEAIMADYECGFKCMPDDGIGGLNVCEKTER